MNKELEQLRQAAHVLRTSVIDSNRMDHALRKQLQIELLLYIATQITIMTKNN